MTSTPGAEGCGCSQSAQRRVQLLPGQVLGADWKNIVDKVLMEDAAEHARLLLGDDALEAGDEIAVAMPLVVYVSFKRAGKALASDGAVTCVCSTKTDPDGSSVCKCIGQWNFDACCDADAGTPPIALKP